MKKQKCHCERPQGEWQSRDCDCFLCFRWGRLISLLATTKNL